MKRTRTLRRSALAVALFAAPLLLATVPAHAVTGTAAADNAYAFTAQLSIGDSDTARACSGVLVDPQWLLTAAGCFADNPAVSLDVPAGPPSLKTTATIGRTDLTTASGQVRTVVKLVPQSGQDVVLAKLASPVAGISPVALASSAPVAGEVLRGAGYGRTTDEWAPLKLHTGTFGVDTVTTGEVTVTGKDGAAVCKGDSGGPLFRETGGTVQLVGINSRSWEGGCFGADASETRTGAVDTRLDTLRTWVTTTVADPTLPPRHDYNGDGRSDIGVWFNYADGRHTTFTMTADSNGKLAAPFSSYLSATGVWDITKMKFATGDYNGDGRADAALAYDTGTTVKIYTALAKPDGGFAAPVLAWESGANSWHNAQMTLHSGDFNGDGRDDLAAWYSYADGSDTLFTFTAKASGLFNPPSASFASPSGWVTENVKYVTGDYNGDGRDDLAGLANYNDGHVTMFTWLTNATGGFQDPISSWTNAAWNWRLTAAYAGDFNGDGRDDVALWNEYTDGHDEVHTLTSSAGKFAAPVTSWTGAIGAFTFANLSVVAGDYNGDGRADLAAMARFPVTDTRPQEIVTMYTWTGKTTGSGLNNPVTSWSSTPGTWNFLQTHLLDSDTDHDGADDTAILPDQPLA